MTELTFREIEGRSISYWAWLGVLGVFALAGMGSFAYIEFAGHGVTGMTNQFVWCLGHVISIFMILSGVGAFVIAAAGTVFNRSVYKPLAPLAGLIAVALLMGGLAVTGFDLGRPDRLTLAMTNVNLTSTLSSNIMRYQGFIGLVLIYLWLLMDWRYARWMKPVAIIAFLWSLSVSTGVGLEFAFLVAREAYDAAVMAPLMVASSFMYGTAVVLLVVSVAFRVLGRPLGEKIINRLKRLLALFVAVGAYMVFVHYLTMLYGAEHRDMVAFLLVHGGAVTLTFWIGQVLCGLVLPLILFYAPAFSRSEPAILTGAALVLIGGLAHMYVVLIGGQAFPLDLFPGFAASSSFGDGAIGSFQPTLVEMLFAALSIPIAGILVSLGIKFFRFLPESLADEVVDPHHKTA